MTPSSTTPPRHRPPILRLPVEIRLQIYNYLLPQSPFYVDLCNLNYPSSIPGEKVPPHPLREYRRQSFASPILSQRLAIENLTRSANLNLVRVQGTIGKEVSALLANLTVRFHCPECFGHWLRNNSYGFGNGIKWLRNVEINYEVEHDPRISAPSLQQMTPPLSKFMVLEAVKTCKSIVQAYSGRLDVMELSREIWEDEFNAETASLWDGHPNHPNEMMMSSSLLGGLNYLNSVLARSANVQMINDYVFPDRPETRQWIIRAMLNF